MLKGIAASSGIAIGKVFLFEEEEFIIARENLAENEIKKEVMRFEFSNLQDTVKLTLVNPSLRKKIHLRVTIFEGQSWQHMPKPMPKEVVRVRQKTD